MGLCALACPGTVAVIFAAIVVPILPMPTVRLVPGLRVRLLGDKASFRLAFSRFPKDEVNGLGPAKLERLGQEAEILQSYSDDTVTCRFDDGVLHDMPVETIEYTHTNREWASLTVRTCVLACMHVWVCEQTEKS